MGPQLKLVSQNFQRTNLQNHNVEASVRDSDILAAQEINLPKDERKKRELIKNLEKKWNKKIITSTEVNGGYIAIIYNNILHDDIVGKPEEVIEGRALRIQISNKEYSYNIINIYGPPKYYKPGKEFCEELSHEIKYLKNVIIIGDWNNMIQEEQCSKKMQYEHTMKARAIKHLFNDWQDIHILSNQTIKYTFCRKGYRARLDRAYIKKEEIQRILKYKIIPRTFSDHAAVEITLAYGMKAKWGMGNWSLNKELLQDERYRTRIRNHINIFQINATTSDILEEWDSFKDKVKTTTIQFATEKRKEQKDDIKELEAQLENVQGEIDMLGETDDNVMQMERIKENLKKHEEMKREGERIRAREEKYYLDERPTSYFFRKEKKRGQNKQITLLVDDDNNYLEQKEEILEETHKFYQDLYKTTGSNTDQIKKNLKHVTKKINDEERQYLNQIIKDKEIKEAIANMDADKSPGEDGITAEFYKAFIKELLEPMTMLFNNIWLKEKQPQSHKNAIIKLLFKKNDHRKLKNWRPISLLNIDYKVYTKVLTARLREIMSTITPMEQKCGVEGRRMTDVIRNINEVRNHNTDGYLVLIDQAKAFDRVNHDYLFQTMEHMGITGKYLNLVKEVYTDISSQVSINGAKTQKVSITRGVRQGCPLSMLLYTISATPVIYMINNNKGISGHTTKKNHKMKIQCYADDSTIIIKKPNELETIKKIYNDHAIASAKINEEKTQIFKMGGQINMKEEKEAKIEEKIRSQVTILGAIFCQQ